MWVLYSPFLFFFFNKFFGVCSMNNGLMSIYNSYDWGSLSPNFSAFGLSNSSTFFLLNVFLVALLASLALFWASIFFSTIFPNNKSLSSQNIGSSSDFVVFVVWAMSTFSLFMLSSFFYSNLFIFSNHLFFLPNLIFFYVFNIFAILGVFGCLYIKGSGQSLSIIYNYVLDSINISSFCTSFLIQLVRISIIVVTLFFLHLLFLEVYFWSSFSCYSNIVFLVLHVLFEVFHSIFLVFMQLVVFLFVLMWLFQFLVFAYSVFHSE